MSVSAKSNSRVSCADVAKISGPQIKRPIVTRSKKRVQKAARRKARLRLARQAQQKRIFVSAAMGDDDGGGFVLNIAGEDGDGGDDDRKGNPRRRSVMKAERKGRHRGWAGKRTDMVGKESEAKKGGGRGGGAGRGRETR